MTAQTKHATGAALKELALATNQQHTTSLDQLLHLITLHGKQHLLEIETDLVQTNYLLSGAIEKLSASFMAIHATASAQQQAMQALLASADPSADMPNQPVDYHLQMREEVNAAITALQFQDMTSQLIARALDHVGSLKASLEVLGAQNNEQRLQDDTTTVARLMQALQQHFVPDQATLSPRLRKSVAQRDMDSGAIELF